MPLRLVQRQQAAFALTALRYLSAHFNISHPPNPVASAYPSTTAQQEAQHGGPQQTQHAQHKAQRRAQRAQRAHPGVLLVGHSMGGVVGRAVLRATQADPVLGGWGVGGGLIQ